MSIGSDCKKLVRAALITSNLKENILAYCNDYARGLLGNNNFTFPYVPYPLIEAAFFGSGKPEDISWAEFSKHCVRDELIRLGYRL